MAYISKINIINYKSIDETSLDFCQKINCFVGKNGVGKTNLLDSIYYLSFCKSHTNSIDTQNIKHNADFMMLQGFFQTNIGEEEIYCGIKRRQKKVFKRNKVSYTKLSDHIGLIPVVLISPNDIELIWGGSEERRRFMDMIISQYDKNYLQSLINYNNILLQRNKMLKDEVFDKDLMDICELQLDQYGQYIYQQRVKFIEKFTPVFNQYYEYISGGNEYVSFSYISQLHEINLKEKLEQTRQRDILIGYTTHGTHKDDLEMMIGEYPIKRVGSQGQNKTYLTSLKLAQFDFIKEINGEKPILLLDDIFDKLDDLRVEKIISLVSDNKFGQIFISDTNVDRLSKILKEMNQPYKIFKITNNKIETI